MGYRSDVLAVLASVHKPEDLVNAMDDIYNDWFGDSYVTDMIRFERNVFFDMYS